MAAETAAEQKPVTERYPCPDCGHFILKTPVPAGWVQAFCPRCREYKVVRLPNKLR